MMKLIPTINSLQQNVEQVEVTHEVVLSGLSKLNDSVMKKATRSVINNFMTHVVIYKRHYILLCSVHIKTAKCQL